MSFFLLLPTSRVPLEVLGPAWPPSACASYCCTPWHNFCVRLTEAWLIAMLNSLSALLRTSRFCKKEKNCKNIRWLDHMREMRKKKWCVMTEKKDGGQKHTTMTDSGMFESMNWWILSGGIIIALKCSGFSCTKKGENYAWVKKRGYWFCTGNVCVKEKSCITCYLLLRVYNLLLHMYNLLLCMYKLKNMRY